MKLSGVFLLIMFMLIKRAYCKEINFKEVRKGNVVEPRYHFNHPPSAEYYNPIPVAVVYEDNNNYAGKSEITANEADNGFKDQRKGKVVEPRYFLNHPPLAENYNPIPVSIEIEDSTNDSVKSKTTVRTEKVKSDENVNVHVIDNNKNNETAKEHKLNRNDVPDIATDNKATVKLVAQPRTLNYFQIPVAIVYESDSNSNQNHHKRKTETNKELPKSRSSYSRKIEVGKNSQEEQSIQTSEEKTEKLQPSIDTPVFKKRTGGRDPVVPIIDMESYVFSHNGNFHYRYEGGDGTKAFSEGKQITIDDATGESVKGGFSYKDKEGNNFSLTYTADENGYRPVGVHLPTPPPIPPAIARALEYLATATPEPVTKRPKKPKTLES